MRGLRAAMDAWLCLKRFAGAPIWPFLRRLTLTLALSPAGERARVRGLRAAMDAWLCLKRFAGAPIWPFLRRLTLTLALSLGGRGNRSALPAAGPRRGGRPWTRDGPP